jgi:hypothetical protein
MGRVIFLRRHPTRPNKNRNEPILHADTTPQRVKLARRIIPNPTDRAKMGTKYHLAVDGAGMPVACLTTAANLDDTLAFERLFIAAFRYDPHPDRVR